MGNSPARQSDKSTKTGRRMSSRAVRIGMIGTLSLVVAACGNDSDNVNAYCVDRNSYQSDGSYQVVDEDNCDGNHTSSYGRHGGYYWYYGGRRSSHSKYRVVSGSTVKPRGATITSPKGKTIQRGGFGGHSSSHSGS
jgi:hypothetical protein